MQRIASATTVPACASCKHQRKKCKEDCILAPFFPVEKTREFQQVHKVFGVSNVSKMVTKAREQDRLRLVDSLIWEASCRANNPIMGSYGEYLKIEDELRRYKATFLPQQQVRQQLLPNQLPAHQFYHTTQGAPHQWMNTMMNNSNINVGGLNNSNNFMQNDSGLLGDVFSQYNHIQGNHKHQLSAERDNRSSVTTLPHQQQLPIATNYNQGYMSTPDQYNPVDSESTTVWRPQ